MPDSIPNDSIPNDARVLLPSDVAFVGELALRMQSDRGHAAEGLRLQAIASKLAIILDAARVSDREPGT